MQIVLKGARLALNCTASCFIFIASEHRTLAHRCQCLCADCLSIVQDAVYGEGYVEAAPKGTKRKAASAPGENAELEAEVAALDLPVS